MTATNSFGKNAENRKSKFLLAASWLLLVALSVTLVACSGQSTTSSANKSASNSSDSVAKQYDNYSSSVKFDLGVFRSSSSYDVVTISGKSKNPKVETASIQVVLLDASGNPLGSYDLQYNSKEYGDTILTGKISGAKGASEAYGLVYAYKLSDGTIWGNSNASASEIEKYGHRIEVDYN